MKRIFKLTLLFCLILIATSCALTSCEKEPIQEPHVHTEVIDPVVAPTCTETGLAEGKHCYVCNEVLVNQTTVDALGHTEVVDEAIAPTCTEIGLTEGKHCSVCNEVFLTQTVVDALGHTEIVDEAIAPTCTEAGLTAGKHCSVCNTVIVVQNTVVATGHTYSNWITLKAPTCIEDGIKKSTCTECNKYEEKVIAATGHSYGDWTVIKEATYLEAGVKSRSCACGHDEKVSIPNLEKLFEDDFSGEKLDTSKWEKCPEWERQGGSSKWDNDMSYLDGDGHLVIKAEWDEDNNRVICGGVRTEGLFEGGYGYYEASIKFSVAEGVWGAFWIQCGNINNVDGSAADGVEIDVVESIHNEKGVFNFALHYDGYGNDHVQVHSGYLSTVNIYDGNFHTFAVERTSEGYIFYVDGIETWRVMSSMCDPCPEMGYLKLTIEAAAWAGSGSEDCINALPIEMLVDYVRVYPENPYN